MACAMRPAFDERWAIQLAAEQVNKHVRSGAEASNFAEPHESFAQRLPALLLRGALAAPAACHREAHFGARINHSAGLDAKTFSNHQEFGFSRTTVAYFIAKLAFVCHRPRSPESCMRNVRRSAGTRDIDKFALPSAARPCKRQLVPQDR